LVPDAPRADDRDSRAADGDLGSRSSRAMPGKRALMTALILEFAAILVLVLAATFAWLATQLPKERDDG
jgi:hypothetical protein